MKNLIKALSIVPILAAPAVISTAAYADPPGGDYVSPGCQNYVFTADVAKTQTFMVLMMPSTNVKYNAHIHVHAISGTL
jgi:hypothetical protein